MRKRATERCPNAWPDWCGSGPKCVAASVAPRPRRGDASRAWGDASRRRPAPPKPGVTEEPGLAGIGIEHAFNTPATLGNCADFLRKHATEQGAQSAMVIVRKSHVGYPQVWKGKEKGTWKFGKKDGIFMQLEAKGARAMFFTELKNADGKLSFGETAQIDVEEFGLFPRIFQ